MSSSRPTESPPRWRDPRSWPLRTQLVATMIVLLTLFGLVVGATAEIFLRRSLYQEVDTKLDRVANPHGPMRVFNLDKPFGGIEPGSIDVLLPTGEETEGGQVVSVQDTQGRPTTVYRELPAKTVAELQTLPTDGTNSDITLDGYGTFRATATAYDGAVRITAISLDSTQDTLVRVALLTTGSVVITLVVAAWVGAAIIRRTMKPLDRVAATATKVSELRLDRGEVRLAQRVEDRDADPRTEVGQVGDALNRMLDHVGNALEARHASEMQVRQFVADASHELRTPLAAIRGYAELSRRSRQPMTDEVSHVLNRVESEAKRMTVLVEDLLLLARLDAGRPLAHDPVDLTMLVVDAVSDAHAAGPRHNWQLDLPEEPVTVVGDGARLHQVLANLLANARTHTPEGTAVTVGVGATADAAVLTVTDTGPGIPAELQPHVFERFARGDSSRSRAAGSTGLGLSIVHAVVTAHRGTVAVDSAPGRTAFTVTLPLHPSGAGRPTEQARSIPAAN